MPRDQESYDGAYTRENHDSKDRCAQCSLQPCFQWPGPGSTLGAPDGWAIKEVVCIHSLEHRWAVREWSCVGCNDADEPRDDHTGKVRKREASIVYRRMYMQDPPTLPACQAGVMVQTERTSLGTRRRRKVGRAASIHTAAENSMRELPRAGGVAGGRPQRGLTRVCMADSHCCVAQTMLRSNQIPIKKKKNRKYLMASRSLRRFCYSLDKQQHKL